MNRVTKRRKRRRSKARLRHGDKAVRKHKRRGGRTGRVFVKRPPGGYTTESVRLPNPPGPECHRLGCNTL